MSSRPPAGTTRRVRIRRRRVAGLLAVVALVAALGHQSLASSSSTGSPSSTGAPRTHVPRSQQRRALGEGDAAARGGARHGPLGEADGAVPDGTTVFDDDVPGVAKLDPALLAALRRAAGDAADDGVRFVVDSGWRSPAYQEHLLREAVSQYGSQAEAARWVATPETSAHVSGDAVDIGPASAAAWLSAHGAAYGLCRIYANESWHFELRPESPGQGCPAMYADPTQDPRMQK